MRLAKGDNICKRALTNEIIIGTNGLSKECKDLADEIGLRDVRFCDMSKGEIKRATRIGVKKFWRTPKWGTEPVTTPRIIHT